MVVLPLRDFPVRKHSSPRKKDRKARLSIETISPLAGDESSRSERLKAVAADIKMVRRSKSRLLSPSKSPHIGAGDQKSPLETLDSDTIEGKHVPIRKRQSAFANDNQVNIFQYRYERLLYQVSEWLRAEKTRTEASQSKILDEGRKDFDEYDVSRPFNNMYNSSSSGMSLEILQKILEDNSLSFKLSDKSINEPTSTSRRYLKLQTRRCCSVKNKKCLTSDSECEDLDEAVRSCEIYLDNTKMISQSSRGVETTHINHSYSVNPAASKEIDCLIKFKTEILNLAHTLNLKEWRSIPLECAKDIEVERLSGALTNAVYVISQPSFLRAYSSEHKKIPSKKFSGKVLLRVYGPQVNHLIDRENELRILQRLGRKKIGPRVLGIFKNGRFEEFLYAKTLSAEDIRMVDTSKQIAKRMRELHDGVELLERERDDGPFVWRNWDKWVNRCEEIMELLDEVVRNDREFGKLRIQSKRGFICGVEWPQFKIAVEMYRNWLDNHYGKDRIKQSLVFAHNDTQYGNILRLIPENFEVSSSSPPLFPANTHKQLVVIDFEYASANTPGLEFANHFTEWCYNYHSPTNPWLCDTSRYPTMEEQTVFIQSYVTHRSQFNSGGPRIPEINSVNRYYQDGFTLDKHRSDISTDLDCSTTYTDCIQQETLSELEIKKKIQELLEDTCAWRAANSCQWVAWGIVQAQIPELCNSFAFNPASANVTLPAEITENRALSTETTNQGIETLTDTEVMEHEVEFDYLSYACDRALFFWGDLLTLGIITKEELPSELVERVKIVRK